MRADTNLSKATSIALGFSAAWYLATYLTLKGSISAGPILISSLIALIIWLLTKDKHGFKPLSKNEKLWALLLMLFGSWSAFTVWLDSGATNLYEVPAKFIVGSLIAIPLLAKGINLNWIKAGVIGGCLSLAYLIISKYDGGVRFSPVMNATKWGDAIAFQTMLTFCLAIIEKKRSMKILFYVLGLAGIYATFITGTRGAILVLIAVFISILFILRTTLGLKSYLSILAFLILSIFIMSKVHIINERTTAIADNFEQMKLDNYNSSVGERFTMWLAGFQATVKSPLTGAGYNYKLVFDNFNAPSPGLASTAKRLGSEYRLFHNSYIDTAVRTGVVGLAIFVALIIAGYLNKNESIKLLMLTPTVGIAAASLTDSSLALGITSTYLIVAGTILKTTRIDP